MIIILDESYVGRMAMFGRGMMLAAILDTSTPREVANPLE